MLMIEIKYILYQNIFFVTQKILMVV